MKEGIKSNKRVCDDTFSITMELERPLFIDEIKEDEVIKKQSKVKNLVLKGIIGIIIALILGFVFWITNTYSAQSVATSALRSNDNVEVKIDEYISFTPKNVNASKGFIFYPGAKVDPKSYAPICRALAETGYQVAILDMPLNMAILGQNKAQDVIDDYPNIEKWAIGGHSLGGVASSNFAIENIKINGVVLLSSYPMNDNLKQIDVDVLSIWGSKDGVVNFRKLVESKNDLPKDTTYVEIEGANHSQFGDYGLQNGDNEALMSSEEQMKITSDNIITFMDNL